jgi:hypothetical protein
MNIKLYILIPRKEGERERLTSIRRVTLIRNLTPLRNFISTRNDKGGKGISPPTSVIIVKGWDTLLKIVSQYITIQDEK